MKTEDGETIPEQPEHRDANSLNTEDLRSEMVRYGIPAHESVPNTLVILQKKFDDEYAAHISVYTKFMERYKRKKNQAELNEQLAQDADDDAAALAQHPKINHLVRQIQSNETNSTLTVRGLNDATSRAVLRALCFNHSVVSLDLANNNLNEHSVTDLARLIRTNKGISSLDLGSNRLNARCIVEIATALGDNSVLTALSLEGNPITTIGNTSDLSGFEALCGYISNTNSLQSLNLFRAGLNIEAGRLLAKALLFNDSIYALELGSNALSDKELEVIAVQMAENRQVHDDMASKIFEKKKAIDFQAQVKKEADRLKQLEIDTTEWHKKNAIERRHQYDIDIAEEKKKAIEEETR